jgi:serine protease Do
VITAAHLVQSADSTVVEFPQGENIRAKVIGCSLSADVALLQLERSPANYVAAKLGDSDQVAVGDEVFVVGDHDAIVSAKETPIVLNPLFLKRSKSRKIRQ